MANEKTFQSRIQLKHSTEVDWQKAINFIPLAGEVIIYDADANNPVRYKIGDGVTNVNALPFATGTAVLYTSQALTNEQKEQARANIEAISIADIPEVPVTSVAGKTGAVTLTKSDVGLSNVTNESKATMFASPVFTGIPTAPTAENTVDNTQVATTAFVHNVVGAISAADLGLEQAMKFLGTTTTDISDASNIDTIIIGSGTVKVEAGNVVLYNGYEYVWTGSAWEQLGQEGSFVLKSTTINGKALNDNITLTADDVDAYTKTEVDTALSSKSDTGHTHSLSDINEVEVTSNKKTVYQETLTATSNRLSVGFPYNKVWNNEKTIVTFNGVEYEGKYSVDEEHGYNVFRFGEYTIIQPIAEGGTPQLSPTVPGETYNIKVDVIETTTIIPDDCISKNIARTYDVIDIRDNIVSAMAGKANSSTTLAGYGITDAYTKTEVDTALDTKVDKVEGKGLSTNDYTTDEKNKLAGIAVGATANIGTITEVIGGNGLTGSATSGAVTLAVGQGAGITVSENEISNAGVRSITQDGTDGHKLTINTGGTNTTITIPDNDTIYNEATTSAAGLMSATDKATFDSIPTTYATKAEVPTIEIVRW